MYFNWNYLLFMLPGLLITMWAQFKVKSTFSKYDNISSLQGLTGAQAARRILDENGLQQVQVEHVSGELTDHYDPKENVIRLSSSTYGNSSVSAIGVAAHECGHAVQYAEGYSAIKLRSAIIPIASIGSRLAVPLIIIGMLINVLELSYAGVIFFGAAVLFQLVTLPVEFDASKRAVAVLENTGMVSLDESEGVRKVLSAAALTYVAALFTSLLQLLYYISLVSGRRGRR